MREELCHMMKSKAFTKPREYMIVAVKQFKVSKRGRTRINGQKKQKGSCQPKIRKTFQTIRIGKQGNGAPHKALSCPSLKALETKLGNHLSETVQILQWVVIRIREPLRFPFIPVFKYLLIICYDPSNMLGARYTKADKTDMASMVFVIIVQCRRPKKIHK